MTDPAVAPPIILRAGLVVVGVGLWHFSQALLRYRPDGAGVLGDGIHTLTERVNRFLNANPRCANALLIVSSLGIDVLSCFVLAYSIFGPSFRPFIGLLMLFFLRQVCQALSALPPPQGMIWRSPGVPSLLVTYGVSNDLFFSGHTALAVFGVHRAGAVGRPGVGRGRGADRRVRGDRGPGAARSLHAGRVRRRGDGVRGRGGRHWDRAGL